MVFLVGFNDQNTKELKLSTNTDNTRGHIFSQLHMVLTQLVEQLPQNSDKVTIKELYIWINRPSKSIHVET